MNWDESEHPRDPDGRFTYARLWRVVSSVSQTGAGGAYFGRGRYFSTDEAHARELLEGYQSFVDQDARLVTGRARVRNPFHVDATDTGETLPGEVMHRALRDAGIIRPGERLTPEQIRTRLQAAGYDSVQVHQPGPINHQVGGNQLLVFNHADSEMDDDWAAQVSERFNRGIPNSEVGRRALHTLTRQKGEVEPVQGGYSAATRLHTYPDGERAIEKVYGDPAAVRAEIDAALVAEAIGAPAPAVIGGGDGVIASGHPLRSQGWPGYRIWVSHIVGDLGYRRYDSADAVDSDDGARIALLDALINNGDRYQNWFVRPDGSPVAFDHGEAFRLYTGFAASRGPSEESAYSLSGFVQHHLLGQPVGDGSEKNFYRPNRFHPDDIRLVRERLTVLHREGHFQDELWPSALTWLDQLERHAIGTRRLIT